MRADFLSRSGQRRVWRGFFVRRTATRGETLCHREESEADRDFVSRWKVSLYGAKRIQRRAAWEERPIGLCQVVRGLAKMSSFLPHLPTLLKCKTHMQNHLISQLELFGKLVKCKPQLHNRWRCS